MKLFRTLLLFCFVVITRADDDVRVYEIQSTADLQTLESENSGILYDPLGNERGSDEIKSNSMDTAIIVLYSIIIFVGLIANSIVFFVIFAGNELGEIPILYWQVLM